MDAVVRLRALGYQVGLEAGTVRLRYTGKGFPVAGEVRPLVELLRKNKGDVVKYLQGEERDPEEGELYPLTTPAIAQSPPDVSPGLAAAMAHPLYVPGLPMARQPGAVEELWFSATMAAGQSRSTLAAAEVVDSPEEHGTIEQGEWHKGEPPEAPPAPEDGPSAAYWGWPPLSG